MMFTDEANQSHGLSDQEANPFDREGIPGRMPSLPFLSPGMNRSAGIAPDHPVRW
jgi:hypothetical protein